MTAIQVQPGAQPIPQPPGAPAPANNWITAPTGVPQGCPPGLEYLTLIDQILCHQQMELLEAFTGWETNNKYAIKNSMGQQIFFAFEDTSCCMRTFCGPNREFTMHIVNNFNQEVMRIHRPFKFCGGNGCYACIDCCAHELTVEAPIGTIVGSVRQTQSCCTADFDVKDENGEVQLRIKGPCCTINCCSDIKFPVYSKDGSAEVGCVSKQWSGFAKEMFTTADNFGITFPMDLDAKMKATLIGATFLIDFMVFEKKNNNKTIEF